MKLTPEQLEALGKLWAAHPEFSTNDKLNYVYVKGWNTGYGDGYEDGYVVGLPKIEGRKHESTRKNLACAD